MLLRLREASSSGFSRPLRPPPPFTDSYMILLGLSKSLLIITKRLGSA